MAYNISKFANANYGIGVTGKLNRVDKNNLSGSDNTTYVSIYDRDNDIYYDLIIEVKDDSREKNKEFIINKIKDKLLNIIN